MIITGTKYCVFLQGKQRDPSGGQEAEEQPDERGKRRTQWVTYRYVKPSTNVPSVR
jgi:hypothetical protein